MKTLADYRAWVRAKTKHDTLSGFEADERDLNPRMRADQRAITQWALQRGRAAEFIITGGGKAWDIAVADDESFTAEGCIVHNCPLQLDLIERAIRLWTNPGDVVLDPFAGIGSVPYKAVEMGRCGVGIELKDSYFKWACRYIEDAERMAKTETLFDIAA